MALPLKLGFRPRFTTRLLLVLMVLIGALLVPFLWRLERAKKQRAVVEEIVENGGSVTYSWETPVDTKLGQVLGREFFDEVTEVHAADLMARFYRRSLVPHHERRFLSAEDEDIALVKLNVFTKLRVLDVGGTMIEDISPLAANKNLEILKLDFSWVKDITPLSELPKLTELDISYSQVGDISPLRNCRNLKRLYLRGLLLEDLSPLKDLPELKQVGVISKAKKMRIHAVVPDVAVSIEVQLKRFSLK